MNAEIYYFSGTGNTFIVARDLSKKINGKLIHISSVINNEKITPEVDIIGIIFPVYYVQHDCFPIIVKRFANKLVNIEKKYIFAVCTFGGGYYKAFDNLNNIINSRGGKLSAGFGVQMPQNVFFNKQFSNFENMINNWNNKIEIIADFIIKKKKNNLNNLYNYLVKIFMFFIIKKESLTGIKVMQELSKKSFTSIDDLILQSDNSYYVDDKCNGCGICSKVCPANNIEIIKNKPLWKNHCETCIACFNWCPQKAIHGGLVSTKSDKNYHYHNPNVSLNDMIIKN